jgi:hypothetical protein
MRQILDVCNVSESFERSQRSPMKNIVSRSVIQ